MQRTLTYFALISTMVGGACVDSELQGAPPPGSDDARDTATRPDGAEVTVLPDVPTETDGTIGPDVPDVVDVPDAPDIEVIGGCRNDQACRERLGPFGACEDAVCNLTTGECIVVGICQSCVDDGDCQNQAPVCTRGQCEIGADGGGRCVYSGSNACCDGPAACDDGDPCTSQACTAGRCQNPPTASQTCCATTPVLATSFSPTPAFQWRSTVDDAGWSVIQTSFAPSPPSALYLGNPTTFQTATADGIYQASATFALGRTTAGTNAEVRFRMFVDLRLPPGGKDYFRVILKDTGSSVVELVNRDQVTFETWVPIYRSVELPTEGPWSLVYEFDSFSVATGADKAHVGILVDDLEVQMGCGLSGCEPGSECPTNDPCLIGRCGQNRECVFERNPDCEPCDPTRCGDGDICTRDYCVENACFHERIPNCISCQCDDGNDCTIDRCDPQTGECFYERNPNCCTSNEQCRDGDFCTADFCQDDGTCRHDRLPIPECQVGPCQNANDCNDGIPCTLDECVNGQCQRGLIDCNDFDPCTFDFCDPNLDGCVNQPDPTCGECTESVLWTRAFVEGEPPDLNIDGNSFSTGWRVDGVKSFSPTRALRFGNADATSYESPGGGRTFGRATGPELFVPENAGGVVLTFMTYIDVDDGEDTDLFRARVLVDNDNLQVWDRNQIGGNTNGEWVPVTVELPVDRLRGNTFRLRWTFDTVNGDANDGEGPFVDDIEVVVTCPTP